MYYCRYHPCILSWLIAFITRLILHFKLHSALFSFSAFCSFCIPTSTSLLQSRFQSTFVFLNMFKNGCIVNILLLSYYARCF